MRRILFSTLAVCTLLVSCNSGKNNQNVGKAKREVVSVASKVPGRVIENRVTELSVVSKGDTLAVLDIPEVAAKLKQAKGALYAASAQYQMALNGATANQLKQINAKYNALKEQFDFAEKSYNRIQNLYADSLISSQKRDEVYMKYQGAKAQFDAVEAEREEANSGVRDEKVKMAYGQMMRAEGAVEEATTAYNERFVVAPKDMEIQTISLRQGELALPGYTLFTAYEISSLYFRFTIPESRISEIKKGQQVKVILPFIDLTIEGEVYKVIQLPQYAKKSSAYPNYILGEAIYEVKVMPKANQQVDDILNESTSILVIE